MWHPTASTDDSMDSMVLHDMTAILSLLVKDSLLYSVLAYESMKATPGLLQAHWQVFLLPRCPDL